MLTSFVRSLVTSTVYCVHLFIITFTRYRGTLTCFIRWRAQSIVYTYLLLPSLTRARGLTTRPRGTLTCFIRSLVTGTEYIVARTKRGEQLPWSCTVNGVVTRGGKPPLWSVRNSPERVLRSSSITWIWKGWGGNSEFQCFNHVLLKAEITM